MAHRPVVLTILDGWGLRDSREANAVALAHTPNFDRVMATFPHARLVASGEDVGLPKGQMGNSEVGHTNIGAGRVVWMDLPRIDRAIAQWQIASNRALLDFCAKVKSVNGRAHVMGLMSPGGVHSHQRHMAEVVRQIAARGVPVLMHLFLDGRDTAQKGARDFLTQLYHDVKGAGRVATVMGRFHAMDRDSRWERIGAAFDVIVKAKGRRTTSAVQAIEEAYAAGETDEFVTPTAIGDYAGTREGDGLMFINFRADRARQILSALAEPGFDAFDVSARPAWSAVSGMVEYSGRHNRFMTAMFPSEEIVNTLGQWVADQGRTQFRVAETEKYPHVTFFLNGGVETPSEGENRHMAPSPRVRTYDLAPEMSAANVTAALAEAIRARYDLIVVNFANPDMVGHTGSLEATIRACEAVDRGLGTALAALEETGGAMIVTADHGNAETMVDPVSGAPHTAHTTNPVPVALVQFGPEARNWDLADGRLGDLAPTVLALMDLPQPAEMTGHSLLRPGKT